MNNLVSQVTFMPFKSFSPMNAAELMDAVFDVYKKSFLKNLLYSLILAGIYLGLIFIGVIAMVIAIAIAFVPVINDPNASSSGIIAAVIIIAVPIFFLILLWSAIDSAGRCIISRNAWAWSLIFSHPKFVSEAPAHLLSLCRQEPPVLYRCN
jgi:hypothetical protein